LQDFGAGGLAELRSWLWSSLESPLSRSSPLPALEYPLTSKLAQFLAVFSLAMVAVSTVTFIVSTADELQDDRGNIQYPRVVSVIETIDNFIVIFFTVEYLLRLGLCPNKIRFVKEPMNVIDFAAIVPFYVSLLLEGLEDYEIIGKTGKIIRLVGATSLLPLRSRSG
jgi:hypothetical protein